MSPPTGGVPSSLLIKVKLSLVALQVGDRNSPEQRRGGVLLTPRLGPASVDASLPPKGARGPLLLPAGLTSCPQAGGANAYHLPNCSTG